MTTISEIARAADVSVDSVLRVLNRDKVSSDIASRVLAVMDAYGYSRLLRPETDPQPDARLRNAENPETPTGGARAVSGEIVEERRDQDADSSDAIRRAREQLLDAVGEVVDELENPASRARRSDNAGIQSLTERMMLMEVLFDRLTRDVKEMKRELGRARNERLEDLTLLVDLITTSWRGVDRRLARIDRKLERMEGRQELSGQSRRTPARREP
jgi:Bacterial regulatory proteins, lacI family